MAKDPEAAAAAAPAKDYTDPPPAPFLGVGELAKWSFYRAVIAEFIATLLFLYITVATVIGYKHQSDPTLSTPNAGCEGVGILGIAWAFGGMIFILVYCTAGISGGHINPAVTFGLLVGRKVSLIRAVFYMVAQCLGAICGVGFVKAFQKAFYVRYGGGANELSPGYSKGTGLAAEIIGTFVLVYAVFAATDPKRNARDSHVPVLAPLPIGFAVFMVHLATIPITGTGINPARSFGAAVIYNKDKAWDDQHSFMNWLLANLTDSTTMWKVAAKIPTWTSPHSGTFKLNVDAGMLSDGGATIGGVLRDCNGHWIFGFYQLLPHMTVLEAELRAIHTGLYMLTQGVKNYSRLLTATLLSTFCVLLIM